jgi:hypothetical protein
MPALGAGIHVLFYSKKDVDGRDKPGHDGALNTLCAGIEFVARPYAGHDANYCNGEKSAGRKMSACCATS